MKDTRTWKERALAAEAGCAEFRKILGDKNESALAITVEATKRGWTVRAHACRPDGTFDLEEEKVVSIAVMHLLLESAGSMTHTILMLGMDNKFSAATAKGGLALYEKFRASMGKDPA